MNKEITERLNAITKRLAEINASVSNEAEDIDVDALLKESRTLVGEKNQIEARKALEDEVAGYGKTEPVKKDEERSKIMKENRFAVNSEEYRIAWLKNLQGKELTPEERTAVVGTAAIPTQTVNDIISVVEDSPILQAVDLTHIPSYVDYPVETAAAEAAWVAMGSAATDSDDTVTAVSLHAYKLIKTVEIDADVSAMAISAFSTWITRRLGEKIRKACDASIFTGSGTNQPTGIITAISTPTGRFTRGGMTYKDLCAIMAALGSDYATNATFAMPRALFFSDVLGMTDTNGQPVVVADPQSPAKYNILGYPVILDDNCTADNVIFGDFMYYKFNFAADPTLSLDTSVGFRTGSTVYRGMALADGKVAVNTAFVRYTRTTA